MNLKFIKIQDPEYEQELKLRYKALRKPLGFPPGAEIFPYEDESLHLVAIEEGKVVGCVLFKPEGKTGRMYQMAVSEDDRGKGIGKKLLLTLENHLAQKGFKEIYIHARQIAMKFYEKMGYKKEGTRFTEIGIPHYKMKKPIISPL